MKNPRFENMGRCKYVLIKEKEAVTMKLVYMAHCVRPEAGESIAGNLASAKAWLKFLNERHRDEFVFIAPWILGCELWDDSNPEERAYGFEMNQCVISRCDELWMVGPRLSNGMLEERAVIEANGGSVTDFTGMSIA